MDNNTAIGLQLVQHIVSDAEARLAKITGLPVVLTMRLHKPAIDGSAVRAELLLQDVEKAACKHLGVDVMNLGKPSRRRELVLARQAVCYVALGAKFGNTISLGRRYNRDHSTIVVARNTFYDYLIMGDDRATALHTAIMAECTNPITYCNEPEANPE